MNFYCERCCAVTRYSDYAGKTDFDVPDTMWAVRARGRGFENLGVDQVPVPDIAPTQLLARVDAAGVCTSILKLVAQGEDHTFINGWDMSRWPVILGDEGAVTLVKVGSKLKARYSPGQRFVIQPAVAVSPINHRERYRDNAEGMLKCAVGYSLPGHLAQYICITEEVLAAECLLPLPDDAMPYFAASMAEPISCVVSAQERNYHILKDGPHNARRPVMGFLPGGVTVVVGAGAMGRMHAELALRFKPRALIVSDCQEERMQKAEKVLKDKAAALGCSVYYATPDKFDALLKQVSGGRGADDVVLALGIRQVQQNALGWLAVGGVANLFGGLPKGDQVLEMDALAVHYKEIKVVGSSGGDPSDMTATLQAMVDRDINPGNYVAAVGSLDNAVDVLGMIQRTEIDGKAILYPHIRQTPLERVTDWNGDREIALLEERLA